MSGRAQIAFEDDHLLVVDKPAGLVVHPGAGVESGTLVQELAGKIAGGPDPERPGVVHRLDRDTSGLLVLARSDEVHAALQELIRRREMEREYLALVAGSFDARTGTIDAPIGRDRSRRTVMSTRTDKPRSAVTHFEVLEALGSRSLLRVRLETGRTHQIRAHMAAIGHPVCGDPTYGGRSAGQQLGLMRQFLHSARVMFRHPVTGGQVECESKPPVELRRALEAARRGAGPGGPDGS
jgi:23S rRNA pseudouridine1911/1915/1917 synthase